MKILILEDDPERHLSFKKNLAFAKVLKIVTTVPDAIYELSHNTWDVLFLDHDLGGEVFVDSNESLTGYHVAVWLEEHQEYKPKNIIIHSLNYIGAARMKAALPEAQLIPSAWMDDKWN